LASDLDLQFQDPTQPLAVLPGSELTLQEDGTWSQPTPVQASTPAVPTPQGASAPVPKLDLAPQAPLPSVPQAPSVTPQAAVVGRSAEIHAPAPASVQVPALPLSPELPQAPVNTVLAQAPAVTPAVVQQSLQPATATKAPEDPSSTGPSQPALVDASQAPTDERVQARRGAQDSAFNNLANPNMGGQDPLKSLALQTARDYTVRESVFKQVYEALREAPATDSGRMLIRLKPAELGEVHIDLSLVNGKLSARLVASQVEVRDAFVRDLPSFKAGLESQGVAVRDISVAVRAGVSDQQGQQPRQAADTQAWWRQLPRQDQAPSLGSSASAGYSNLSVTDQRFSALA
jgi:flagellar hook-length control protein FliK